MKEKEKNIKDQCNMSNDVGSNFLWRNTADVMQLRLLKCLLKVLAVI